MENEDLSDVKFKTIDLLKLSCAIYRCTGCFISVQAQHLNPTLKSNADILRRLVINPESFEDIIVSNVDLETANSIIKFYHRLTFNVLNNTINDFQKLILKIIDSEEVTVKDFKIIACLPSTYNNNIQDISAIKLINETEGNLIGRIGDNFKTFCYIIELRSVKSHKFGDITMYSHTAITTEGYLIEFLSKQPLGELYNNIQISSKVKDFKLHFKTNKPITQLNYVRLV